MKLILPIENNLQKESFPASPLGAREGCNCLGCQIMRQIDKDRNPKPEESLAVATPDTP